MNRAPHSIALRALVALALGITLLPDGATAVEQAALAQDVSVAISQPTPSVASSGILRAEVVVTLDAPAEYLEVRLRLKSPSGILVYQKTEVRSNAEAGRIPVAYEYDLARRNLPPGSYPIEIRVLATGSEPTSAESRLLITDPAQLAVPVAVVLRLTGTPMTGPDGRMLRNPATDTRLRDDVAFIAQLAIARDEPLALSLPPVLIEDLARVASGYETTAGVVVDADAETPARYREALEDLRLAVSSGTITLIATPYALPDAAGIQTIGGASGDFGTHWTHGDALVLATLGSAASTETVDLGATLTSAALASAAERGADAVLAHPDALTSIEGSITAGVYRVTGSEIDVICGAVDVAAAVRGETAFYDAAFGHRDSTGLVIPLDIGPGGSHAVAAIARTLDWIGRASWLRVTDIDAATRGEARAASLTRAVSRAPEGYWESVGAARQAAEAYTLATGADDASGDAARRAVLVAESSLWAGADGSWANAADGAAFAAHAAGFVADRFSLVRVDAKDVTLAGRRGEIPFTVVNGTDLPLTLTIVATPARGGASAPSMTVALEKADNYLTLPVDLGASFGDEYTIVARSGSMTVASVEVAVRASYIDRLAVVGMVVVVLVVLLIYIRKRMLGADAEGDGAGTISSGVDPEHEASETDGR
jgi:hypothetical protein